MKKNDLILRDMLAIDRTRLANERTFLAYFRTFIVILSSAIAILKLDILEEIRTLGYFFLVISPILMGIGLMRFFYVRKSIKKYYYYKT